MSEIGSITPRSNWSTNRAANVANDTNQSRKRRQQKKQNDDEDSTASNNKKSKKQPPNNISPHFDEYA